MLSYEKAFSLLSEKGYTTYKIRRAQILSANTWANMKDGKSIKTETIDRLCALLGCQPGDLMEYLPDPPANEKP